MIKITENVFLVTSEEEYKAVVHDMYGMNVAMDVPDKYPCIITPTVYYNKVTPNNAHVNDVYHAITGGASPIERCVIKNGQVTWEHAKIHELREGDVYREPDDTTRVFRMTQWSRVEGRTEIFAEQLPLSLDSFILELGSLPPRPERKYTHKITYNRI